MLDKETSAEVLCGLVNDILTIDDTGYSIFYSQEQMKTLEELIKKYKDKFKKAIEDVPDEYVKYYADQLRKSIPVDLRKNILGIE